MFTPEFIIAYCTQHSMRQSGNTLAIMATLKLHPNGLLVDDIARQLRLSKTTIRSCLHELMHSKHVRRTADKKRDAASGAQLFHRYHLITQTPPPLEQAARNMLEALKQCLEIPAAILTAANDLSNALHHP